MQVNYVGKAANLYEDGGYKLHGSAYVINKYLGTTWLWDRVRVSGGAYGGFSDFDSHSGMFTYLSYRDPNLLKTVDNYDGESSFKKYHGADSCCDGEFSVKQSSVQVDGGTAHGQSLTASLIC